MWFKGLVLFGFVVIVLWITNLVKVFTTDIPVPLWGGKEIARVIGIFIPPLGAALGFF
ncbi:Uncharacterised protein [Enterobacter hormaechei]|uniref:Uncharacterized protein n=1 Tax=Kluyvera ascorbata TaxID=51288 RepID=A0AB35XIQ4_9ENTR|nr:MULTISPECIES: hypothetical protein [Enterobacter cloacae complex]HCD6061881.1 hypothetical protein [Enterobacter asburiae]HDS9658378.1 hypothetical protein [Klebsiella pneumoniae subsp. pneumoniae]MCL5533694.1 hypothetical protein [Enterobacter kobei]CZW03155.1 Uncharacterised protein [Enterobacter hormaechei]SAA84396.1 Uncharacterised protein [Enterobacter hormaechei]